MPALPIYERLATPATKARIDVEAYVRRSKSGKLVHVKGYDRRALQSIIRDLLASDDPAEVAKLKDGTQLRVKHRTTSGDREVSDIEAKFPGADGWTKIGPATSPERDSGNFNYSATQQAANAVRNKSAKSDKEGSLGGPTAHPSASRADKEQDKLDREAEGRPTAAQETRDKKAEQKRKREEAEQGLTGDWLETGRESEGKIPMYRLKRGNVVQVNKKKGAFIIVKRDGSNVWIKPFEERIQSRAQAEYGDHRMPGVIKIDADDLKAVRGGGRGRQRRRSW